MPIDLTQTNGCRFAICLINREDGKEEEGLVLFGIANWDGSSLTVFREDSTQPFPIPDTALDRVKKVTDDLKDVLENAQYWVLLHVGPKPHNAGEERYIPTGFKWPQ